MEQGNCFFPFVTFKLVPSCPISFRPQKFLTLNEAVEGCRFITFSVAAFLLIRDVEFACSRFRILSHLTDPSQELEKFHSMSMAMSPAPPPVL